MNHRAFLRLGALLVFGLTVWSISCRPTWASDSSKLVYPAKVGARTVLAECEVKTGATRIVRAIGPADGAGLAVWDAKGAQWVLVEADGVDDNVMLVMPLDDNGKARKRHEVNMGVRNVSVLAAEPVVHDGRLFLTGKDVMRIDLETGETKVGTTRKAGGAAAVVCRYGAGLAYAIPARPGASWEIGTIDPETLVCKPMVSRPDGCDWDILAQPQFESGSERCAVVGFKGKAEGDAKDRSWAILVVSAGKIESTLELGKGLAVGPLRWGPDRVTIYATLVRIGEKHDTFALYETNFSGSVTRETALVRNPVAEQQKGRGGAMVTFALPFAMQPSVSPDGLHVAFTTALLPELPAAEHGLLLIGTRDPARKVTRVPFPAAK